MKEGYYWHIKNPDEAGDHVEREIVEVRGENVFYFGTDYSDTVDFCLSCGDFTLIELI